MELVLFLLVGFLSLTEGQSEWMGLMICHMTRHFIGAVTSLSAQYTVGTVI